MAGTDTPTVRARRARLKQWIQDRHEGRQADFVATTGINQGMVSALLRPGKAFGEKQAASIEVKAKMPAGYLVNPTAEAAVAPAPKQKALPAAGDLKNLQGEVEVLTMLLGSMFTVMLRHRPAEAQELLKNLDTLPARMQGGGILEVLRKVARASKALGTGSL